MSTTLLEVYGPDYDPETHSWPKGVRPTGPTCRTCKGRGEGQRWASSEERARATIPSPRWEPGEPEVFSCPDCGGTGVRPPR